jgi:hypothetical protein
VSWRELRTRVCSFETERASSNVLAERGPTQWR